MAFARANPLWALLFLIAATGILKGSYTLLAEASRQLAGPLWGDAKLYVAGGRAILNGINPYAELFESKPPFMFWLSAISLKITGDHAIAAIGQVLSLLVIAVTPAILGWNLTRGRPETERTLWRMLALLGGIALAAYAGNRSGYIQTEAFGTAFGALFVAVIYRPERMTRTRTALAALFLFCALWTKEPFIVILGACALILMRHPRDLLKTIIIPGIIALVIAITLMWALGYLDDYVRVYLPAMAGHHVYGKGSPWTRMWNVHKPFVDLWTFSPGLAVAVVTLCTGALWQSVRRGGVSAITGIIAAAIALIVGSYVVGLAGQYYGHHFIFALPILLAVLVLWVRDGDQPIVSSLAALTFAAGLFWLTTPMPLWIKPFWHAPEETAFRATAETFDQLMDACGYDRYMAYGWELEDLWAHTRHTPYASTFSTFRWYLSHEHPQFAEQYSNELNATPIIVIFEERVPQIMQDTGGALLSVFTRDIPACAAPFLPLKDGQGNPYTMLFRKPIS